MSHTKLGLSTSNSMYTVYFNYTSRSFNPTLDGGGHFTTPSWFSLNSSRTVKAITLEFCSISNLRRSVTILKNLTNACFCKKNCLNSFNMQVLLHGLFWFNLCFDSFGKWLFKVFFFSATCLSLVSSLRMIFQIQISQHNLIVLWNTT